MTATPSTIYKNRSRLTLFAAGLCGFFLGAWAFPGWQDAVEGAQVLAGVVRYTAPSPWFDYQINLWTLSHQVLAVFLRLGAGEGILSVFLNGILGALSFQAIALLAFTFSKDAFFSALFPVWVYYTRTVEFESVYPVLFFGGTTYGILGLFFCLLTLALIGLRKTSAGFFMAGLAPAIHPALGSYFLGITFLIILIKRANDPAFGKWKPLLYGLTITAVSFALNRMQAPPLTNTAADFADILIQNFNAKWCPHRIPAPFALTGFWMHLTAWAVSGLALFSKSRIKRPDGAETIFIFCFVSGILGTLFYASSWIPPERVPAWFSALMPARFINFNLVLYPALLFGWMLNRENSAHRYLGGLFLLFLTTFLQKKFSMSPHITAYVLLLAPLFIFLKTETQKAPIFAFKPILRAILLSGLLLMAGRTAWVVSLDSKPVRYDFYQEDGDFWNRVSRHSGMLLSLADTDAIQIRTRRPILIDPTAIDALPYAPASAVLTQEILADFFQADLLKLKNHPDESLFYFESLQKEWPKITADEWKRLAQKYSFTQILVNSNCELQLPIAEKNHRFTLYDL